MRSIASYMVLVGLPILAIIWVLQFGKALQAPISVGGAWNITLDSQAAACPALVPQTDKLTLTIAQSGTHLRMTLNDVAHTSFAAELHGTTITSTQQRRIGASQASDSAGPSLQVQARVDRSAEPDRLSGELILNTCPAEPPMAFTAIRMPSARNADGGH